SMEIIYREDEDPSIFVLFKAKSKKEKAKIGENAYLLVWTTTPWTIPANMLLAVHPDEKYSIVNMGDKRIIVATKRLEELRKISGNLVVEGEVYGSELEGLGYEHPLLNKIKELERFEKYHRLVLDKSLVNVEEGSGIVHIAPAHGIEDYYIGKKNKVPLFSPVSTSGLYSRELGIYEGIKVPEEANKKVISDLREAGALFSESSITHSYPHCWRCEKKIIYIATEQWFINIQKVKNRIIRANKKVKWHPEEAQKWQEDFLINSPDWTISRQRYWGVPMPIWLCECGNIEVIGSIKELEEKSSRKEDVETLHDLHRPYIDKIGIKCIKCGKEMKRIKDVFDVWFDSSVAFRASLSEEMFATLFPADFILEAIEQLRGWFSYQIKVGSIIYGKSPFKNVVMHGMLLGSDGREMHKHLGNYVPVKEIAEQVPTDAFRLWCASHNPKLDLLFSMEKIKENEKDILLLYNIKNLIEEYREIIGKEAYESISGDLDYEDVWILSRFNRLLKEATESLNNYDLYNPVNKIKYFLREEFSRVYIKLAKKSMSNMERKVIRKKIGIISFIFRNILIMLSIVAPFSSESIYISTYGDKESIFLNEWPRYNKKRIDENVEKEFRIAIDATSALLNIRERLGIKLRWALKKGKIETNDESVIEPLIKSSEIIKLLANLKEIEIKKGEAGKISIEPNYSALGPEFRENTKYIVEELKKEDPEKVKREIELKGSYEIHTTKGLFSIRKEHVKFVKEKAAEGSAEFKYGIAYIEPKMDEELREEAILKEIIRRIQLIRKRKGLKKKDMVSVTINGSKEIIEAAKKREKEIERSTNAKAVKISAEEGMDRFELEDNEFVELKVEKL
ncbi:MAG: class I tRNA ligase family protein, partial [Candidatus Micrarchaeaceae archaeon]